MRIAFCDGSLFRFKTRYLLLQCAFACGMARARFFQLRKLGGFTGERSLKFRGFLLQHFDACGLLCAGRALFALCALQVAGEAVVLFRKRAVVFQQLRVLRLEIAGRAEAFLLLLRRFQLFFQAGDLLLKIVNLRARRRRRLRAPGGCREVYLLHFNLLN
ncbi:hypothetical protein [Cronobacter turicensis]|uniref:hypothetical protein n=1 Tax=Cronobacter turicensis TaxID=413502 RepID=UPI001319CAD1|nr:hypothetical protein [Cronobacter turicensis]